MRKRIQLYLIAAIALLFSAPALALNTATIAYQFDNGPAKPLTNPTRANIQALLDQAPAKKLWIQQGAGNIDLDSTLWFHGNTYWFGQGKGISTLTRTRFNAADPAYHGDIINSARNGMHTPNLGLTGNVPTDSLANITIEGVTLDGNYTSWPGVDPNGCNNFGMQFWFVDNLNIRDVEVKNTLQTGIELDACRNSTVTSSWIHDVGKQLNVGTRNGLNFNNNSNNLVASSRWGRNLHASNLTIDNHRDTMIDCANVSEVTISDIRSKCDYDPVGDVPGQAQNDVFEFEGSIAGYTMRNFTINNIIATGHRNIFFTKGGSNPGLDGLKLSNFEFTAGTRSTGIGITFGNGPGGARNIRIENGILRNLNAADSTNQSTMLYCYSNGDTIRDVVVQNVSFLGAAGGTYHPSNRGAQIGGNLYNFKLIGCTFRNVEGEGVGVFANGSDVAREITVQDCFVDGAQREGFIVEQSGVTGGVNGVRFYRNVAKDTNKNTSGYGFRALATSGDIHNVWFLHNKIIRTSGTNMNGLQLNQSGGGSIDSAWVVDNELTSATTTAYGTSGTVTNIYLKDPLAGPPSNNQFDNNVKLQWKNTGGSYVPVAWLDSLNTVRLQAQTGGNIDLYRSDGVLGARFSGGDWNVTNGGGYVLGGFQILRDNSNERRLILKSSVNPGKFALRDSANALNLFQVDQNGDGYVSSSWNVADTLNVGGATRLGLKNFASLGSPSNGYMYWCTDCQATNPCAGIGVGALARRQNGVWNCGGDAAPDPFQRNVIIAADSARVGSSGAPKFLTVSGGITSYGDNHMGYGGLWMNFPGGSDVAALKRDNPSTLVLKVPQAGSSGSVAIKDNAEGAYVAAWADNGVWVFPKPLTFSTLPASVNGCIAYCSDCTQTNPTAASGPGAIVRRENSQWNGGATGATTFTTTQTVDLSVNATQDFVLSTTAPTVGRPVVVGVNAFDPNVIYQAQVTAVNQVTLRAYRTCGTSVPANSRTFVLEIR